MQQNNSLAPVNDNCALLCYNSLGRHADPEERTVRWRLLPFKPQGRELFLFSLRKKGGDRMDAVRWEDLIQLALLTVAIVSCYYNSKKR